VVYHIEGYNFDINFVYLNSHETYDLLFDIQFIDCYVFSLDETQKSSLGIKVIQLNKFEDLNG
jgi:hypothetical protein